MCAMVISNPVSNVCFNHIWIYLCAVNGYVKENGVCLKHYGRHCRYRSAHPSNNRISTLFPLAKNLTNSSISQVFVMDFSRQRLLSHFFFFVTLCKGVKILYSTQKEDNLGIRFQFTASDSAEFKRAISLLFRTLHFTFLKMFHCLRDYLHNAWQIQTCLLFIYNLNLALSWIMCWKSGRSGAQKSYIRKPKRLLGQCIQKPKLKTLNWKEKLEE